MVALAKSTPSVVMPGRTMYLDENTDDAINPGDAVALMEQNFPVTVTVTKYAQTQEGVQQALAALEAALAAGNAPMIGYPSDLVWPAVAATGYIPGVNANYTDGDHAAVATQVDLVHGLVYVNDSSMSDKNGQPVGKGAAVPLGAFLAGWQAAGLGLTVVAPKNPV
jgi:hypothetical protein